MHEHDPTEHAHHHDYAHASGHGERRTRIVVVLTVLIMLGKVIVGEMTHSMALLADGAHMATDAGALGLALFAYWYARTRARSGDYTFGTGKVYALAGYTSAIVLAVVALWMIVESVERLVEHPIVDYGNALPVAIVGFVLSVVSVLVLGHQHPEQDEHDHHEEHDHEHEHHHDHNLRAVYIHVLSDAVTGLLAIGALCAGKWLGWWYLDPSTGIVGGVLIGRWSLRLCRDASRQLLDAVPSRELTKRIAARLEGIDDVKVADLHLWEIAPGKQGCIVSLVTGEPRDTMYYREAILGEVALAHLTIEVHRCERGHA